MNDTPTPLTNAAWEEAKHQTDSTDHPEWSCIAIDMRDHARELEHKFTACNEMFKAMVLLHQQEMNEANERASLLEEQLAESHRETERLAALVFKQAKELAESQRLHKEACAVVVGSFELR